MLKASFRAIEYLSLELWSSVEIRQNQEDVFLNYMLF